MGEPETKPSDGWRLVVLGVLVAIPAGIASEMLLDHTLFSRNPQIMVVAWGICVFLFFVILLSARKRVRPKMPWRGATLYQPGLPWFKQLFPWIWAVAMASGNFARALAEGKGWKVASLQGVTMLVGFYALMLIVLRLLAFQPPLSPNQPSQK